ncbi:MAG: hypothetical protein MRZ98_05735 [Clostridiales bacterium]|nr:hypothetical protein [Clostridiales bacterium]
MNPLHFFAGGNTAQGFFPCFEDILPEDRRKRVFYLKGGPGVGKSTLMRRVAAHAEAQGIKVEYFHCSSDPDSLDGICLPEKGLAMMDGTAPHVYDPAVPGARDTLLSLGDFLDEKALRPHADEIAALQRQISARFRRCYQYLAAAERVLCAPETGREDPVKMAALSRELAEKLPLRGGRGGLRRLFAAAYTPRGRVDVLAWPKHTQMTRIERPFGLHATGLMQALTELARCRGLDVIQLLNPLSPGEVDGLYLPGHDRAFVSGPQDQANGGIEAAKLYTLRPASDKELSFDRNAYELLIQRATEQLTNAKALHDQLEGYYCGHMDFARWQGVLDQVLTEA